MARLSYLRVISANCGGVCQAILSALTLSLVSTQSSAIEMPGPPPYECDVYAACGQNNNCHRLDLRAEFFAWQTSWSTWGFDGKKRVEAVLQGFVLEGLRGRKISVVSFDDIEAARSAFEQFLIPENVGRIMIKDPNASDAVGFRMFSLPVNGLGQRSIGTDSTLLSCSSIRAE